MTCPVCESELIWQSDFMCDEVFGCPCGEGIVGFYVCPECDAEVQITLRCKGEDEE